MKNHPWRPKTPSRSQSLLTTRVNPTQVVERPDEDPHTAGRPSQSERRTTGSRLKEWSNLPESRGMNPRSGLGNTVLLKEHSGATPSNRGDAAGGKMDHSQASQATSGRGGKKITTPQNRGKNLRNRKQSRSDDEESEETFVPKHQMQSHPAGKDSKGRYQTRGGDHRDSSEESEPEYQVKNPQLSPRLAASGGNEERIAQRGSKDSSLNAGREDPSVPAPRSRRGADNKTNNRPEKDSSPKRTKDKKKAEVVYYQRVEKPNRSEQDQVSNDTTPKPGEGGRLNQQNDREAYPERPYSGS